MKGNSIPVVKAHFGSGPKGEILEGQAVVCRKAAGRAITPSAVPIRKGPANVLPTQREAIERARELSPNCWWNLSLEISTIAPKRLRSNFIKRTVSIRRARMSHRTYRTSCRSRSAPAWKCCTRCTSQFRSSSPRRAVFGPSCTSRFLVGENRCVAPSRCRPRRAVRPGEVDRVKLPQARTEVDPGAGTRDRRS